MSSIFKEILGRTPETPDVDRALAGWRNEPREGDALSEEARRRILKAIRPASQGPSPIAPLASLFVPARRAAVAAIVPALLVGLSVALFLVASSQPTATLASGVQVQAHKVDGDVVFVIANGGQTHRVFRSESPAAGSESLEMRSRDGAFRDRLRGNENLVFYRVD